MNKTRLMRLNSPWYEYVKSGEKIYEGRKMSDKTRSIKVGDMIHFKHYTDTDLPLIKTKVLGIHLFSTFKDALTELPIKQILPFENLTIEEGVHIYYMYVSEETQKKDGVCMIRIERV